MTSEQVLPNLGYCQIEKTLGNGAKVVNTPQSKNQVDQYRPKMSDECQRITFR